MGSGSDGGCFAVVIRLVYDRHKMVVAQEERRRYGVGKIFINGGALRGAEGERVVGIEDSQRDAVHATSEGETLLLQVADGALFETCGSRDKNSFAGQINVIFQHKSNLS